MQRDQPLNPQHHWALVHQLRILRNNLHEHAAQPDRIPARACRTQLPGSAFGAAASVDPRWELVSYGGRQPSASVTRPAC
jgi:hypothetical protein